MKNRLVENLLRENNFNQKIKDIISRGNLESTMIINKIFDLYKPLFRDTDTLSEFERHKHEFSRMFAGKLGDLIDQLPIKQISINEIVEYIQTNIKKYLPIA